MTHVGYSRCPGEPVLDARFLRFDGAAAVILIDGEEEPTRVLPADLRAPPKAEGGSHG